MIEPLATTDGLFPAFATTIEQPFIVLLVLIRIIITTRDVRTVRTRTVHARTIIHESTIHGVFIRARAFTCKTDFSFLPLHQNKITSIFVSQLA